jgi:hypothetical protein
MSGITTKTAWSIQSISNSKHTQKFMQLYLKLAKNQQESKIL